jgi:excisionase family DNA binding protein
MSITVCDMSDATPRAAYTVEEFCRSYGIGRTRLYELFKSGAIEARKCGSKTLIPRASAEAWLASLPRLGSAA